MQNDVVLAPGDGKLVWLYDLGVRFMVSGAQTDGRFALVEHPIRPKALAAPLHTHADEDEISYVLEGEVGMQIGDDGEYERAAGNTQNPARGRAIHHLLREGADVYSVMNQMQLGFVYVFLSQIAQHRM